MADICYSTRGADSCEQLVTALCDIKQAYTIIGGSDRSVCLCCTWAGTKHYGFQLYQSDPSGNYGGWRPPASATTAP
ncbi:hypothetical protein DPEC_G00368270 [Dallia pectoralis]|nr:hypothetical protein DPEC_G00368270 [Dallia pectoralis]